MSLVNSSFRWYNSGLQKVLENQGSLTSQDIKLILVTSSYTPLTSHTQYSDITNEVANGNGYTTGGLLLVNKTFNYDGSGNRIFLSDNPAWTFSASKTARYWVLYNDSLTNKDLLCYGHLNYNAGSPVDITSSISIGIVLTTAGWFTLNHTDNQ